MKNKDFLRRAAAFAVSLSFISYSGMADICSLEAVENEKVTTSTGKTSVTAPVTTPSSSVQTTTVTTAPVTAATTVVTTQSIEYKDYTIDIDKKVNYNQGEKISKYILGDDNIKIDQFQNKQNILSVNKGEKGSSPKKISEYLSGKIKSIEKSDGETEKYIIIENDCYYISKLSDYSIELELCLYLSIDDNISVSYNDMNGEMILANKVKIGTVEQFNYKNSDNSTVNQFCVRSKNIMKCYGQNGWSITNNESEIKLDITPEDDADHYVKLEYNNNNTIKFINMKSTAPSNKDSVIKQLDLEEISVELNISGVSDKNKPLSVHDSSNKDISESTSVKWSNAKYFDFNISYGYTYDVYVYRKNDQENKLKVFYDSSQYHRLSFESDEMKKFLYEDDVVIDIDVRPVSVSKNVIWKNDSDETENNTTNEKFSVVNSKILFPYLERKGENTYYLSKIEFNDKNKKSISIEMSELVKVIRSVKYSDKEIEYHNNDIKCVVYSKIDNSTLTNDELVNYKSVMRNLECQSVKLDKNIFKLFNNSTNTFLNYRAIQQGKYANIWFDCENGFYITRDNKFLQITSILEIVDGETISELKLDKPENIYIDTVKPKVSGATLDPDIKNEEHNKNGQYWSNNTYDFSVCISDIDEDLKQYEEIDKIVNTPSENCSEISSVDIGGYVFTNNNGEWINTLKPIYSQYTVSITSVEHNGTNGFNFNISVALNENVDIFNDNIKITASDICDNVSDPVTVKISIDKTAPEFKGMDVQTIVANAEKAMAVKTITDGRNKTAAVDVTADIIDPEYLSTIIEEINDPTETTVAEDGSVTGQTVSIHESEKTVFGSGIKTVKAEYITDNEETISSRCDQNADTYTARLDGSNSDNLRNSNGKIKITAEDYAGNISEYYYYSRTAELASKIIFDTENPECSIDLPSADYKHDEKNWYRSYPSLKITAVDNNYKGNVICSGLQILNLSINDTDKVSVDVKTSGISTDDLKSGKYSVKFASNDGVMSAVLTNGTLSVPLIDNITPNFENKYNVKFSVSDYSGNESFISEKTFYIDITPPKTESVYQIEKAQTQSAYGNFSNGDVDITVRVYDEAYSSGLKQAVLTCFGKEYTATDAHIDYNSPDEYNGTYKFTVPGEKIKENTDLTGNINISVTDNVGNTTVVNKLKSQQGSDLLTIENIPPQITSPEIIGDNHYHDSQSGKDWYSGDVTVTYGVSDKHSGIKQADYKMYQDHVVLDRKEMNYSGKDQAVNTDKYTLTTSDDKDGEFDFSVDVIDNSGNTSQDHTLSVYKDKTNPDVTDFEFEDGIVRQWKDIVSGEAELDPFGFFHNNDAAVTVYARDDNASSGIKLMHVDLINSDGSLYTSYDETVTESDKNQNGQYSKKFNVPEGFKGRIEAYAVDNVNNVSDTKSPNGYVSENGGRHASTSGLHITLPSTEYKDISRDSLPLYAGDVTSKISVDDSYSGISKVEWNTSDFNNDQWHEINIDSNGNISGDDSSEWQITSTDRNLVTAIERNITVSANRNNDHIVVRTTDNSGNVSQTEEHFSIDKTAPSIEFNWNNTTTNNYYNADRTVTVSVNERNFKGADIKINDKSQPLDFKLVSGAETEGTDRAVYRAEYTFSSDGEFELSADCTDMCGNKAQNVKSGKFIIDKTKPVLNVSFTDASGKPVNAENSKYYSSAVNAVISVTETNFNNDLISVGVSGEKKNDCTWRDNGNIHTTVVPFSSDGDYRLTIDGKDIAGNSFDAYSYDFCIDMAVPSVDFGKIYDVQSGVVTEGMRPADNSSQIAPVIVINDKNLNPDNIKITLKSSIHNEDIVLVSKGNQKNYEYLDTNECYYDSKSGKYVISLYNISQDDIYDITVDAYDMSGNKGVIGSGKSKYLDKTGSDIKFSVNRNGSTFELAEDTAANINKKYLKQPKNVSIREINVNEHSDDPDILIHKDIENQENPDVNFTENEAQGFVEYIYDLPENNFEDLAKYSVDVLSSDIAGNKNSSSAVKEKNAEDFLSFWVDSEEPDCSLLNIQSDEEYSEAQMQCRVQITDNIEVDTDSIRIMLDGNEVNYKLIDTNVYAFDIDASNKERTIQVNCCDMAQNTINETVAEHFMVSKNPFVIFFHKKIVKMLTAIIGGTAIVSGAAITIFRRKRRIK